MKLTVAVIAKMSGISERSVRKHIQIGWLKAEKVPQRTGSARYEATREAFEEYKKLRDGKPDFIKAASTRAARRLKTLRHFDCIGYGGCLEKAARKNGKLSCKGCKQHEVSERWKGEIEMGGQKCIP